MWSDRRPIPGLKRWWIEEIDTTGLFEIPPAPPPRDRFSAKVEAKASPSGTWNTLRVGILDHAGSVVAEYDRNYPSLYQTFESFRQGDKTFALISTDYTATSVIDLTGKIVAAEEPSSREFCPVGFYVPD
jgi:hypothetical protein